LKQLFVHRYVLECQELRCPLVHASKRSEYQRLERASSRCCCFLVDLVLLQRSLLQTRRHTSSVAAVGTRHWLRDADVGRDALRHSVVPGRHVRDQLVRHRYSAIVFCVAGQARSRVEAARLNHDTDATGYQVCAQLLENQSMAHVPRVPHPRSTSFVLTWLLAADLLASQ
jgi:hypothetical protein